MKQVNTPLSGDMPAKPSLVSILKRKNVLFACLGILSMYWLLGTIVVTFSRYLAELQIAGVIKPDPKMALGVLLSIFGLAAVALNYLFGHLADSIGRKYPLIVAFFMLSIAPLLISNPSVPLIVISWIITWSISASIIWPTLLALLTDELAPHERGAGLGVFMLALMIGTGMGMPVMGAIEGITGASGAIKIAAVFPIITFIVAWFLRPKPVEMGGFGVRAVITTVVIIIALIGASYPLIRFLQP
jgi:predicted MFS family arabinose efflux permease